MTSRTRTNPAILLTGADITSCPVKVQNAYNPLLDAPEPVDADALETFADADHLRETVMAQFRAVRGSSPEISLVVIDAGDAPQGAERLAASMEAMASGADVILSPELPADKEGHRCGHVDVLIGGPDTADGKRGYHPLLVTDHTLVAAVKPRGSQRISRPTKPALKDARVSRDLLFRWDSRSVDTLRLAHAWRLLESCGHAAGPVPARGEPNDGCPAWGALIGSDRVDKPSGSMIVWIPLTAKLVRTFTSSASGLWKRRSALTRADHELDFRVAVARRAQLQSGSPDDPPLAVQAVRVAECATCQWWPHCSEELGDDVSAKIERSPLDAREIMALRSFGVRTITDLARIDVDSILEDYLPMTAHRSGGETRLRLAARRGRLMAEGRSWERLTTGPIALPTADIDIDLDIETSAQNRVYLWGFLVTDHRSGGEPTYHAISRFARLTKVGEADVAEKAALWLRTLVEDAAESVLVWHYSPYEPMVVSRLAASHRFKDSPGLTWLSHWMHKHFVDLLPQVRKHFFGVEGLGLKKIATAGAGFEWRDPEPSGLNSQLWFADAIHGSCETRDEAQARILQYNEDDVRATHALRQWMRSLS